MTLEKAVRNFNRLANGRRRHRHKMFYWMKIAFDGAYPQPDDSPRKIRAADNLFTSLRRLSAAAKEKGGQ
jgi:hypothetical protein